MSIALRKDIKKYLSYTSLMEDIPENQIESALSIFAGKSIGNHTVLADIQGIKTVRKDVKSYCGVN